MSKLSMQFLTSNLVDCKFWTIFAFSRFEILPAMFELDDLFVDFYKGKLGVKAICYWSANSFDWKYEDSGTCIW